MNPVLNQNQNFFDYRQKRKINHILSNSSLDARHKLRAFRIAEKVMKKPISQWELISEHKTTAQRLQSYIEFLKKLDVILVKTVLENTGTRQNELGWRVLNHSYVQQTQIIDYLIGQAKIEAIAAMKAKTYQDSKAKAQNQRSAGFAQGSPWANPE